MSCSEEGSNPCPLPRPSGNLEREKRSTEPRSTEIGTSHCWMEIWMYVHLARCRFMSNVSRLAHTLAVTAQVSNGHRRPAQLTLCKIESNCLCLFVCLYVCSFPFPAAAVVDGWWQWQSGIHRYGGHISTGQNCRHRRTIQSVET